MKNGNLTQCVLMPSQKGPDSPSFMGQKYQETQDQILGTTQKVDFSQRTNS